MAAPLEGFDIYIQNFVDDNAIVSQSFIQKAFDGINVLLTGASSFIGSVILEKLIRSCPGIKCFYVLIREKDGVKPTERLREILRSPLFDSLKMTNSSSLDKVHAISCDLSRNNLGISESEYSMLISNTNVVIHCARLIGSDVKLRDAILVNIKGLQGLLDLSKKMNNLDALAYLSNVFAHGDKELIEEKLYDGPTSGKSLMNIVESFQEETLDSITDGIINKHLCASTYTIAVAESLINDEGKGLPISIIRSSLVLASVNEPISGWIQKQHMESPTDILLNVFLGNLFATYCDGNITMEAVPVDKLSNLVVVTLGNNLLKRRLWLNEEVNINKNLESPMEDIQVFNLVMSKEHKQTWSEFFKKSIEHVTKVPFIKMKWYPSFKFTNCVYDKCLVNWFYLFQIYIIHKLGGGNSGGINETNNNCVFGCSCKLTKTCNKFKKFISKRYDYKNDNVKNLWNSISASDKTLYDFNLSSIDWNKFFYTQCRGLRVYLSNDPLDTVPDALNTQKWMKKMNTISQLLSALILVVVFVLFYFYFF